MALPQRASTGDRGCPRRGGVHRHRDPGSPLGRHPAREGGPRDGGDAPLGMAGVLAGFGFMGVWIVTMLGDDIILAMVGMDGDRMLASVGLGLCTGRADGLVRGVRGPLVLRQFSADGHAQFLTPRLDTSVP
jgi:hypothetical protein